MMTFFRNSLIPLLCLFLLPQVQAETIRLSTQPDLVTVFLNGAEINRSAEVSLQAGENELVFEGLSPHIQPNSIRLETSGGVSLLSISSEVDYLVSSEAQPRLNALNDSLLLVGEQHASISGEIDALNMERQLLEKNIAIGGSQTGVPINDLKQAADFYRSRIKDINVKKAALTVQSKEVNEVLQRLKRQLKEQNAIFNAPRTKVIAVVQSTSAKKAMLRLRYLVNRAAWSPHYDLRASDVSEPIVLQYRAKVFNDTGIDWVNAKLKLSTADPNQSVAKPHLKTWTLNFKQDLNDVIGGGFRSNVFRSEVLEYPDEDGNAAEKRQDTPQVQYQQVEVAELKAEFEIETLYTIPAIAKPYTVDITEYELPAEYSHFAIPKLDKEVFLLAHITNWQDLNLIEGPASVFYRDTYMGQSYIQTRNASDTLDLSLGKDARVMALRSKRKDHSGKKFLGTNIKETFVYEIKVKNNRSENIQIEINDQIPVSQEKDIQVELTDKSGAELDELSGKLTWKFDLKPGKSRNLVVGFWVKYPKNKTVHIRKSRTIYSPRF